MGAFKNDLLFADIYLVFYEPPDIKLETTVRVIKAVLIKLQILQFDCCVQTCNGPNKMRRKKVIIGIAHKYWKKFQKLFQRITMLTF